MTVLLNLQENPLATVPREVKADSNAVASFNIVSWKGMKHKDGGALYTNVGEGRSVQVSGTFGVGGRVRILGSNDGKSFYPLKTPHGIVLDFTEAGIEAISEETQLLRPEVVGGDSTTALDVTYYTRRVK